MNVNLSPTELTLVAAAVNEKIAWLDASIARLRAQADEADAWSMLYEAEDANRIMRAHYAAIIRRIEQALDVPFMDQDEALAILIANGEVTVSPSR
jgi:hypothetical protein